MSKLVIAIVSVILLASAALAAQATRSRMSPALVKQLLDVKAFRPASTLIGLGKTVDGSTQVFVISRRAVIARTSATAAASGGVYEPPDADRYDEVVVHCGDAELKSRFDCAKLSVAVAGRVITPLFYRDTPRTYRNGLGASWTAREVDAVYSAISLQKGFTITYWNADGVSWLFTVGESEAGEALLLSPSALSPPLPQPRPPLPPHQPPPPGLQVKVLATGVAWEVTNLAKYSWADCSISAGGSEASIGRLAGEATVTVTSSHFHPNLPLLSPLFDKPDGMVVRCASAGETREFTVPSSSERRIEN